VSTTTHTVTVGAAYSISDQSINTTTAATGESVIRGLLDPIAVMHVFGRVLRSNFHPTAGRHRQNTPDELQGPGCPTARFATGPSFSVGGRTTRPPIFGSTEPIPGVYPKRPRDDDKDPRLTIVLLTRRLCGFGEGAKLGYRLCRAVLSPLCAVCSGIFPYATVVYMGRV